MEVSQQRLEELEEKERKLQALENGGVDNWEWYDEAISDFIEWKEKKERINSLSIEIQEEILPHIEEPAGRGAGYGLDEEGQDRLYKILKRELL